MTDEERAKVAQIMRDFESSVAASYKDTLDDYKALVKAQDEQIKAFERAIEILKQMNGLPEERETNP